VQTFVIEIEEQNLLLRNNPFANKLIYRKKKKKKKQKFLSCKETIAKSKSANEILANNISGSSLGIQAAISYHTGY
jgi:hypothetical protein